MPWFGLMFTYQWPHFSLSVQYTIYRDALQNELHNWLGVVNRAYLNKS